MKPLDFPLLRDENIGPGVVDGLRARGCDVRTAHDENLAGRSDSEVLTEHRSRGVIVYLRPGHVSSSFVLTVIDAIRSSAIEVRPPFIAVAERQQAVVRVRTRTAPPW